MQDLKITLIQSPLHWENAGANLAMFEEKIWQAGKADVIILPEMFTTGFSMEPHRLAEVMNQQTTKWMAQMATQTGALILGSFIAREGDRFFNRLVWMEPDGKVLTYDKRHLFRMAEENKAYTAGNSRLTGNWKGWKICPLVCYDLRFPVWSRNRAASATGPLDYDVLIYVANWPKARAVAWQTLLQARAIENHCYVAGVNRIGTDGKGIVYGGDSAVCGPKGEQLMQLEDREESGSVTLSFDDLCAHREKFPAWLDGDAFHLED